MTLLRAISILLILMINTSVYADDLDSLLMDLKNKKLKDLAHSYNLISGLLLPTNADSALWYASKAREVALINDDDQEFLRAQMQIAGYHAGRNNQQEAIVLFRGILHYSTLTDSMRCEVMMNLGELYLSRLDSDSAAYFYKRVNEYAQKRNMDMFMAPSCNGLARIASNQGDLENALSLYTKAINYYLEQGDETHAAIILNNIGTVFLQIDRHKMALPYFDSAIRMNIRNGDNTNLINNYINISNIFKKEGQFDSSLVLLSKARTLAERANKTHELAGIYYTMASIMYKKGNMDESRKYADLSMQISLSNRDNYGIFSNNMLLVDIAMEQYNYALAKKIMISNLSIAIESGLNKGVSSALYQLAAIYKSEHAYDSALYYYEQYLENKEKINEGEIHRIAGEWKARYNEQSLKAHMALMEKDKYQSQSKMRAIIIILIILIAGLLFVLIYRYQRSKNIFMDNKLKTIEAKKNEAERQRLESELEYRQKELTMNSIHMEKVKSITDNSVRQLKALGTHLEGKEQQELGAIIHSLQKDAQSYYQDEFELRFKEVHSEFYRHLLLHYPDLNKSELKLCGYLRLNMSSKDIADITGKNIRTIENTRSRIRSKLGLNSDDNLVEFLLRI